MLLVSFSLGSYAQPSITSFTPATGPIGTSVTISGTNFGSTPANNIVFIGGMKAHVTSATSTSLTITVPACGIYQPISVTTNGLTAYSNKPFVVTFSGAASKFTSQSFAYAGRVDSVSSDIETTKYAVGDIDDDNKIDIVTIDRLNNTMSVYRNMTAGGNLSFAPAINFATGPSPRSVTVADVDGDGKPDIIVTNLTGNTVSIFRNTTTAGVITFAAKKDFTTATQPAAISVADLDKDGKPDLVINTVNLEGYISILRNTGSIGTISFAAHADLQTVGGSIEEVRTADIDGDGKSDIVLPFFANGLVKIYRNTSTTGNITFDISISFGTLIYPDNLEVGDFNNDDKIDIAVSHYQGNRALILQNQGTVGNIHFRGTNYYPTESNTNGCAINDLDGDGKPDLVVGASFGPASVFKNVTSPGALITLSDSVSIPSFLSSHPISADFDNDGKPDMAFNSGIFRVAIWRNRTTSPQIFSFSPTAAKAGDTITINGDNFTGTTSVTFGGVAASSYTIVDATKITAIVGSGATGDVKINTAGDSANLPGFLYTGPPVIFHFSPASAGTADTVIIKGQNFTGATDVKFGGVTAAFTIIDPFTIQAIVAIGASGDVAVTNPYGTGTQAGFSYIPKPSIASFSPAEAITGTIVTIKGLNFLGTTSVSFGGNPAASYTIIDSTTIHAVVANGSSGKVQVSNVSGSFEKPGFAYFPAPVINSFAPVEAAQGDTVTISGSNFLHNYNGSTITAVKFGGVNALSFTIIDSFTIQAKVYAGASGAVSVESSRGNASKPGFTFIAPPVIYSASPNYIGQGCEVTITGQNLSRTAAVSFGGVPATSFTIISDSIVKAIVGMGATGYVNITTPKHSVNGPSLEFKTTPVINSIFPTSGPVGTTVTISGINFQPGASNNTVYFGGARANILSATNVAITVSVPPGAQYKPITVTSQANKLTAISNARFSLTFPGDTAFNDSSFAGSMDFATGGNPTFVKNADVDGDGKLDIIVVNEGSTFVSIFRNTSSGGRLSFAPRIDIEMGFQLKAIAITDIDGDGKLDMAVSNSDQGGGSPQISIFHNQCTPGSLSFVNAYSLKTPIGYSGFVGFMESADFDLDGRPDLVSLCTNCSGPPIIGISTNSTNGAISFGGAFAFSYMPINAYDGNGINSGLGIADYNHDGKPDVFVGMYRSSALYLFKNITQPGFLFFGNAVLDNYDNYVGYWTSTPLEANFSSHQYPDIVAGLFVYRNYGGGLAEVGRINVIAYSVYDLNGDGKQDILGTDNNGYLSLIRNIGDSSNPISFASTFKMNVAGSNWIEVGDLDGDGKPEICLTYRGNNILRILRNRMGEAKPPPPSLTSFSPDTSLYAQQILITGNNLGQATSVTFGGVPALYFTIISEDSILATVANGASGYVKVTTPGGADSLGGYTLIPLPVIASFTPTTGFIGTTVAIVGQYFTGATNVSFGGIAASSFTVNSPDTITAVVGNGATGTVSVTTPGGTARLDKFTAYLKPVIISFTPKAQETYSHVTISGSHFESVSSVSFGGVAATSYTVSPDYQTIVALIGPGASGSVTVVNPAGADSMAGFEFAKPVITSFSPDTANTGSVVTIKGHFLMYIFAVDFGGAQASSFTIVDSTTITAVVGNGASGDVHCVTPAFIATLGGFTFGKVTVTATVDPSNVNSKELIVTPNPAQDILIIKHPASAKNASLRFIDILGHTIKTITPARHATHTETSVINLSPGVYSIIWTDGVRTLNRIFAVQR